MSTFKASSFLHFYGEVFNSGSEISHVYTLKEFKNYLSEAFKIKLLTLPITIKKFQL